MNLEIGLQFRAILAPQLPSTAWLKRLSCIQSSTLMSAALLDTFSLIFLLTSMGSDHLYSVYFQITEQYLGKSAFDVKVLALVPPPEISIHQGLWNYRYDLAENDEHYSDKWNAVEFWRVCRTRPYRGRAFNIWTQLLLAAMVTSILLNICSFLFSRRLYLLLGLLTGYGLLFAVITSCLTAWEYTTCLQELQSDRATGEPRYFLSRSYVTKLSLTGVSFMSILLAFACQLFRNLAALFVLLFHTANL